MGVLRKCVRMYIMLGLLLSVLAAKTDGRALISPLIEKRNLSQMVQAFNKIAEETVHEGVGKYANTNPYEQPTRLSPGGPDPHHH